MIAWIIQNIYVRKMIKMSMTRNCSNVEYRRISPFLSPILTGRFGKYVAVLANRSQDSILEQSRSITRPERGAICFRKMELRRSLVILVYVEDGKVIRPDMDEFEQSPLILERVVKTRLKDNP